MSEGASNELEALRGEVSRLQSHIAALEASAAIAKEAEPVVQPAFLQAPYFITIFDIVDDHSFAFVAANPASYRASGLKRNESGEFDKVNEETTKGVLARLKQCAAAERPLEFEEFLSFPGHDLWTQSVYTSLGLSPEGKPRIMVTAFDITERKAKEQQDVKERELIIEQQEMMLAELSTPILRITDRMVVMPLIGAIDSRRAQQVMDSLLTGVAETQASIVIMDITGVIVVDTQVANALLRAAQAVQLLGARVVLTGIRPEIAQTMVGLGVDLAAITTHSTLQSAVNIFLK